jgi:hypothetical protein
MASTYSQYKIELIGTGDEAGQWGTTLPTITLVAPHLVLIGALNRRLVVEPTLRCPSTTITLSLTDSNAAQDARALYLNLSGTPGGAADLVVPALQKSYLVKNGTTGGYAVTIKVTGQTGVSIPNGKTVWVYNNGTDVVTAVDHIPSLTLGAALPIASGGTGSTSTTFVNLATNVTGTLPVANGGTGITSFGTGVATFLGTPSSANLAAAVTDETGTGALVFANTPTLESPGSWHTDLGSHFLACTVDGTDAVGFRNTPVNSQSADYTLLLADSGKTIFHPAADANDRIFTIPAESSVNYAVGTVVTFINLSANDLTIAITTDTMYLANDGDTGDRTLAEYGMASAMKVASTTWIISGNGLT